MGQQLLSAEKYPTLHLAIPAIEWLMSEWEKMQDHHIDAAAKKDRRRSELESRRARSRRQNPPPEDMEEDDVCDHRKYAAVLQAGIAKLGDYYIKMEASDAYAIAMSQFCILCLVVVLSTYPLSTFSPYTLYQDGVSQ